MDIDIEGFDIPEILVSRREIEIVEIALKVFRLIACRQRLLRGFVIRMQSHNCFLLQQVPILSQNPSTATAH